MKRFVNIFLIVLCLIASCSVALAQYRAFGGRIGYSIGASGQYNIGKKNMLQIDLDLLGYNFAAQSTVTYNWLFPIKTWKNSELNAFTGIGAGGGYCWRSYYDGYGVSSDGWGRFWFVGVVGNLGLEVNFKSCLQLSIDWRPIFAPVLYKGGGMDCFLPEGLIVGAWAVGVRYKFKK